MINPCISIDRKAKKYAIFDGFDLVGEFTTYENEDQALEEARAIIARHTDTEPEVIYPVVRVTSFNRK